MRVHWVELTNFKKVAHALVTMGATTVVAGPNGLGKSSILDGISYAIWDRTIEGTTVVPFGTELMAVSECRFTLAEREFLVTRRSAGKARLTITIDSTPLTAETTTKLQAKLEEYVGSYAAWRRSCVFTGDDVAQSFGAATDAQRKQALEAMLGLSYFDEMDVKAAKLEKSRNAAWGMANNTAVAEAAKAETLASVHVDYGDPVVLGAEAEVLKNRVDELQTFESGLSTRMFELNQEVSTAKTLATEAQRSIAFLTGSGECSTCHQPVPVDKVAAMRASAEVAVNRAERVRAEQAPIIAAMEAKRVETSILRQGVTAEWHAKLHSVRQATQGTASAATLEAARTAAVAAQAVADQAATVAQGVTLLRTALSWKGPRATILADVVGALSSTSNFYLTKLSGYLTVIMEVVGPDLKLDVVQDGVRQPFKSCSKGERKRVAVAILLAMAEMNPATRDSMLVVDEAFDGLDAEGVEGLIDILAIVAETRQVMVISHDPNLTLGIIADCRITATRGPSGSTFTIT